MLRDKVKLIIVGLLCSFASWCFFHYLGKNAFYAIFGLLIFSYGIKAFYRKKK